MVGQFVPAVHYTLPDRAAVDGWRERAIRLGVNPDEPDDHKYWSALERAQFIVDSFKYHVPSEEQIGRISNVRNAAIATAEVILQNTPAGADQTAALRQLHEAMMTANKSIVTEPKAVR